MADVQFPRYSEMIIAAILCLNGTRGSSINEISKYITSVYGVSDNPDFVKRKVKFYLMKGVERGVLVRDRRSSQIAVKSPQRAVETAKAPESPLKAAQHPEKPEAVEPGADEPVTQPDYSEMIVDAIDFLNEIGGASPEDIFKFITSVYGVSDNPDFVKTQVQLHLKNGVESGTLFMAKTSIQTCNSPLKAEQPSQNPEVAEQDPAEG